MSALMRLDQAGLPAGDPGFAREDGLATGALVTLTSLSHARTFRFRLLWVGLMPTQDTTSIPSLTQSGPSSYSFSPTAGVYGSWLVELITDEGTIAEDRSTKVFAIKQTSGLRIPAPNEKGTPDASMAKNTAAEVAEADFNAKDASGIWVNGRTVSWWKEISQLIYNYNAGIGAGWYEVRTATGSVTAVARQFVQITPAGATSVITTPAPAANAYFGVQLCGQAGGKIVEIRKPDTTLLATLLVDDESAWFAYDATGLEWRRIMRSAPDPIYTARFSPLATWLSSGADANLSDTSGNSRTLTKAVSIAPAVGLDFGRLSSSYAGRYTSADAAFNVLGGAVSCEYTCFIFSNASGSLVQVGSGPAGSATGIQYKFALDAPGDGTLRMSYVSQSGSGNAQLQGPYCQLGWQHLAWTRSAGQTVKFYVNGVLGSSQVGVAPSGGASSTLFWGGVASDQGRVNFQQGSLWNTELTAAQVAYLAALRMGRSRL